MLNVSQTELDVAVQNTDDASNNKRSSYLEKFDYSKNNCLKENPKIY